MSVRRDIQVRAFPIGQESDEILEVESILHWRKLGPSAAWRAMFDMLDWWFTARGLDPAAQRVDRTHIEIHPAPWAVVPDEAASSD